MHASFKLVFLILLLSHSLLAQREPEVKPQTFSRADTLRGMLTPERSCYDVTYYHLDIKVDPEKEFISGSNTIRFLVDSAFNRMQVDLFRNMEIQKIVLDNAVDIPFVRDSNATFLSLPQSLQKNSTHNITIFYSGKPLSAKNPPWVGGFTWRKDSTGNPWVVVTCQGTGASLWWPNKDHQSDEPDSMLISVTVPPGLQDISNGRLREESKLSDGWTRYDWFVSYPINNYNVTLNIGKYTHFSDEYISGSEKLTLDYYVLPENLEKAKKQFTQVKPVLKSFEKYFGLYPFIRDGFKLIECPHNGMEHQSAVAYGNRYLGGYVGRSSSEVGLKFDFIIVHESSHEWWGNSVTSQDIADMWIHESFGAYAEALYVEDQFGREASLRYINGKKQNVGNSRPIIGTYNVNNPGSDMYDKGQLVLNTLRSVIDNDKLWFSILRGIQETFKYRAITADSIFQYVNAKTGTDFGYFFDQYLKHAKIPALEVFTRKKGNTITVRYRWRTEVQDFRMPVKVTTSENRYEWITPTAKWQSMEIALNKPENFKVAEDLFYINVRLNAGYTDERLNE